MATERYLSVSKTLASTPGLATLLGTDTITYKPAWMCWPFTTAGYTMLAWGRKPSAAKAQSVAKRCMLKTCYLEDAFLRSIGQGFDSAPCGVVVDDLGIYYDATAPSRLEQLIAMPLSAEQQDEAEQLAPLWRKHRVSKYNNATDCQLLADTPFVLLIDQTYNDASVHCGLADAERFSVMLQDARARYPQHKLVIKTHPDVVAGKKRGYLAALPQALLADAQLVGEAIHVVAMLEHADAVFTVTSQVGFEALLWQKPVYVYGMPFYAGWGLTQDYLNAPERRQLLRERAGTLTLSRLAHAALIRYARYIAVDSGEACSFYQLVQMLSKRQQTDNKMVPGVTRLLSQLT